MITKNEALTLRKCLESLQGIADEVVLVDTGSSDETVAIAQEFGCKVYTYKWNHDFAAARNESLRHATGDFILVIDADEYLDAREKVGLRDFLAKTDAEGIFVISKSYLGSLTHLTSAVPIRVLRLFRNGHFYTGAIHEQIAESILKTGKPVVSYDLTLHHLGYTDEFLARRAKTTRNTALLEAELHRDPQNVFQRSNLIVEYMLQKDWVKAERLAEKTWHDIKSTPPSLWPNFTPRIALNWMTILWERGKKDAALRTGQEAIYFFPWYTDLKRRYATFLMLHHQIARAIDILMECRAQGDVKPGLIESIEGSGTYFAAYDLGVAWALLGDDLQARRWFLQAFQENTAFEAAISPLIMLAPNDPQFLYEHFEKRIWDTHTYGNYAEAYAIIGFAQAKEVVSRAVQACGETETTHRAAMALLVNEGEGPLSNYAQLHPADITWLLLGIYKLEQGDQEGAHIALQKAGPRGHYLLHLHQLFQSDQQATWSLLPIARDLIAMRAERFLRAHLHTAQDVDSAWLLLKYSPLKHLLFEVEWQGHSVWQYEMNALRALQQKQYDQTAIWLKKARAVQPTVTQTVMECNLHWAQQDQQAARKSLLAGKKIFPHSELLKHLSALLYTKTDPIQVMKKLRNGTSR
ncbi:TPR domain-containing glycosyltransferase [Sulfoacidibacillus thermotolerans]|nr:TPR domain-containing glycosyltransferase [Sulfoacidibacillus thermotolerans]